GRGQDAARIRLPRKEVVAVLLNVQPEVGREAGRVDRRDADQRVEETVHPVVDDLARRNRHTGRRDARQVVLLELVEHIAGLAHQHRHARRVQQVERPHVAVFIPLLQRIRVPAQQLRERPPLLELDVILVVVGLHEQARDRRLTLDLGPDPVGVALDELRAHLAHVRGDQRDAGVDGVVREYRVALLLAVALPRAGERLADDGPPAGRAELRDLRYRLLPAGYLEAEDAHVRTPPPCRGGGTTDAASRRPRPRRRPCPSGGAASRAWLPASAHPRPRRRRRLLLRRPRLTPSPRPAVAARVPARERVPAPVPGRVAGVAPAR